MGRPNYTQPALTVTDGAEVSIVATTFCQAIYVTEQPTATGWPRGFLYRGTVAGSAQHPVAPGTTYRIPGPFSPGDVAGQIELKSAGGDTSTFNVAELSA